MHGAHPGPQPPPLFFSEHEDVLFSGCAAAYSPRSVEDDFLLLQYYNTRILIETRIFATLGTLAELGVFTTFRTLAEHSQHLGHRDSLISTFLLPAFIYTSAISHRLLSSETRKRAPLHTKSPAGPISICFSLRFSINLVGSWLALGA